jgi:hypothetical protein
VTATEVEFEDGINSQLDMFANYLDGREYVEGGTEVYVASFASAYLPFDKLSRHQPRRPRGRKYLLSFKLWF